MTVRDASFEIIRVLFDHGVLSSPDSFFILLRVNGIDVLNYFIDQGAFINSVIHEKSANSYEQEKLPDLGTPLHPSVTAECLDMVNVLLSRRADPSIKNSWGKLAVEEAKCDCLERSDRPFFSTFWTRLSGEWFSRMFEYSNKSE